MQVLILVVAVTEFLLTLVFVIYTLVTQPPTISIPVYAAIEPHKLWLGNVW